MELNSCQYFSIIGTVLGTSTALEWSDVPVRNLALLTADAGKKLSIIRLAGSGSKEPRYWCSGPSRLGIVV